MGTQAAWLVWEWPIRGAPAVDHARAARGDGWLLQVSPTGGTFERAPLHGVRFCAANSRAPQVLANLGPERSVQD